MPRVLQLDEQSVGAWDRYVDQSPEATFFHRAGWSRVIERSFGHRTYFVYAEQDGAICGVLPLVHVRSALFGNVLTSTAFCVYGGPVASDSAAARALDQHAIALADRLNVDYLEYRNIGRMRPDWACRDDLYATFRKPLDPDPEKNLLAIPRKQRAMVRKGIKEGLRSEIDGDARRLHRLYAESVRNLGTPVFGGRYFENLKREFGDRCEISIVLRDDRPVSGVMSFFYRDEVLPYYGGGSSEARSVAANDFMYWEVMRRACEQGYRSFDFGRSKVGTGAFAFKKNWGFSPEPLHYEYKLRRRDTIPDINPLNPKYRLFVSLWKRLPLFVANMVGPYIVRNLG